MFTVKIHTDNAAFYDDDGDPASSPELARILRRIADDLDAGTYARYQGSGQTLRDINGNDVGRAKLHLEGVE